MRPRSAWSADGTLELIGHRFSNQKTFEIVWTTHHAKPMDILFELFRVILKHSIGPLDFDNYEWNVISIIWSSFHDDEFLVLSSLLASA
jgi:hypothetical protein